MYVLIQRPLNAVVLDSCKKRVHLRRKTTLARTCLKICVDLRIFHAYARVPSSGTGGELGKELISTLNLLNTRDCVSLTGNNERQISIYTTVTRHEILHISSIASCHAGAEKLRNVSGINLWGFSDESSFHQQGISASQT